MHVLLFTGARGSATSRKVADSIPYGVIGIFHRHNPSGHIVALGVTQPLTEMNTRNISWGVKTVGGQGWQPYHLNVPIVMKFGGLNLLESSGLVQACDGIALPLLTGLTLYIREGQVTNIIYLHFCKWLQEI